MSNESIAHSSFLAHQRMIESSKGKTQSLFGVYQIFKPGLGRSKLLLERPPLMIGDHYKQKATLALNEVMQRGFLPEHAIALQQLAS